MKAEHQETFSVRVRKQLSSNGSHSFLLDADVALPPGITILFGPSGSGKTTILQCVAGLIRPDAGRIAASEHVFFDSGQGVDMPVSQRSVGYVFQDLALFPHLTVERNIQYGLSRVPAEVRRERTQAVAESFHIAHLLERYPHEISGGERQRVALARALVTLPRVLLLDEPLSGLDASTKSRIIEDLRAWNEARRIPVVYVTHSRREVFALGERVVVMEHGRVLAEGTPQEVLDAPRHETIAQLAGFENIFDATVTALRESHGTMSCRLAGSEVELEVPLARVEPGLPVRVAVRAGDILLASQPPSHLSARNVLAGRLLAMQLVGVTVNVRVDCGGLELLVNLTPSACEALQLQIGHDVWLVLKTHSCHLVRGRGNGSASVDPAEKPHWTRGDAPGAMAPAGAPGESPARRFPRLKVLYLLAVTALAFAIPAWSFTYPLRWDLLLALLALQVLLLLRARVAALDIARGAMRLRWLFLFLVGMYVFLPSDTSATDQVLHWQVLGRSLPVNLTGLDVSLMMCLQLTIVILVSAVVRLTGSGSDLVDGLRGFGLPHLFVYSVDYTLALLGGIQRKGMGGGMGGGKGKGRRAQAGEAAGGAAEGPPPGLFKVMGRLLRGDVGFFTTAVQQSLARAHSHVQQESGGKLDSRLAHDVAAITGISLMMMSLKMLKILPGIPFFSGFKTILLYPLYILAADLTYSRWGGTVCGTIMGVIGFMQGDGRYGAFEILKHTAPGVTIDLSWPLAKRLPRSIFLFCAMGFVAAIARTSTEFVTILLLRSRDAVYLFPVAKLIPNMIAGTLSGFVTFFVLRAFRPAEAETKGAAAPAEPAAPALEPALAAASPMADAGLTIPAPPAGAPGSGMGGGSGRGGGGGGGGRGMGGGRGSGGGRG